jgi:hypothetical protein
MKNNSLQPIVFLHIPKAGGTTLRAILKRQYRSQEIFEIGSDINRDIVKFTFLPMQVRYQIKLLIGHMTHGLHALFPKSSICLTMLRDPVSRVYSEYRFLSSNKHHPLYSIVSPLTYHQYLDLDPTRQASNGQTRLISGSTYGDTIGIPGIEPIGKHHLARALENLERFYPQVGLLERYDESLLLWCQRFNWQYPLYEKKNISRKVSKPLDSSEIEHTLEKNQFDAVLYKRAAEMLDLRIQKQPRSFKKQLTLFQISNNAFQRVMRFGRNAGKKLFGSAT